MNNEAGVLTVGTLKFVEINMWKKSSLWKSIFLFFSSLYLTTATSNQRANLAQRHPCYPINKRLEPYIKWTERLVSTQYRAQKDACGQSPLSGPACCTNEIFNSYAISLGNELKISFDEKLSQLKQLLSKSDRAIDVWTREYLSESRRRAISSLETLFGTREYHADIHHAITTLFNTLGNQQSRDEDVSKAAVHLFNQLILATYRRFMTEQPHLNLDDQLQKCLVNTAFSIEALPTQREVLYTLSSAASLIRILRTLFIYIEADIEQLKTTVTLRSQQCLQRYVRETLCPICLSAPTASAIGDSNVNEPLCENDCHFVIKNCFNESNNPYIAFALIAQGYSDVIKQIEASVVELKLVERLSKLHIYFYDMVVNATNNRQIHTKLQAACPNPHAKPFSPILSLSPTVNERPELVIQRNESLHSMLNQLQSSISNLDANLTQQTTADICSNSKYAVKSNRCTRIDQSMPADFSQWPLPSIEPDVQKTLALYTEPIKNQVDDLNKKLQPIQQIILSFRPKKKPTFYVPDFGDDEYLPTNDHDSNEVKSVVDSDDIDDQQPLSDQLYQIFDQSGASTTTANRSQSRTYKLTSYLFVLVILITHRISFANQ